MLGNFYAVNSDDTRALAILNDAVSRACAAHGPNSIIALECKYHLGIAFFIQKNFSAALDCVAPLMNAAMLHGMIMFILLGHIYLIHFFNS